MIKWSDGKENLWDLVNKTVIITCLFWVGFLGVSMYAKVQTSAMEFIQTTKDKKLQVAVLGEKKIFLERAETDASRKLGLSGRKSLEKDRGMLFVFDSEDTYGIWMKDMNFSIDIVWLDEYFNVLYIEKDVSPSTYPKIFYPSEPALYILELNSGFIKENGIKKGDILEVLEN